MNQLTLHPLVVDKSLKDNVCKITESLEILRYRGKNEWYSDSLVLHRAPESFEKTSLVPWPWDVVHVASWMAPVKEMAVSHSPHVPSSATDVSAFFSEEVEVIEKASMGSEVRA